MGNSPKEKMQLLREKNAFGQNIKANQRKETLLYHELVEYVLNFTGWKITICWFVQKKKKITLIGLVKEVKPYSVYRYLYILARVPK